MTEQDEIRLLADESFINYSLGHNKEDIAYWENFLKEHPWELESIAGLKEIILLTTQNIQDIESNDQLASLMKRIEAGEQSKPVSIKQPFTPQIRRGLMAASLSGILLISALAWYNFSKTSTTPAASQVLAYNSKKGERKSFQLPDGTMVILNADSHLILADDFGQKNRTVNLDGEAFFDVVHDKENPFIVHTAKMDVKVLGTEFNVNAYANGVVNETALIRGSIELTLNGEKKKVILHPNQKFVIANALSSNSNASALSPASLKSTITEGLQPVIIEKGYNSVAEISWTENKLVFVNEPFNEVIKKLERWYGISIELQDASLATYTFTATFRNESIKDVLSGLQFSRHFEFNEQGGKIIIKK